MLSGELHTSARTNEIEQLTEHGVCTYRLGSVAWRDEVRVGTKFILQDKDDAEKKYLVQIRAIQPHPDDPNLFQDVVLTPALTRYYEK